MGEISTKANEVYRDKDGSSPHYPEKPQIRQLFSLIDSVSSGVAAAIEAAQEADGDAAVAGALAGSAAGASAAEEVVEGRALIDGSNISSPGVFKPYLNIFVPALEDLVSGVGAGNAAADQAALALAAASGKAVKADREYLLSQRVTMAAGSMLVSDTGKGKVTMRGASGAFDAATRAVGKEASNNLGFYLTGDKSGIMGIEIAFDGAGISAARTASAITVDGADECVLDTLTLSGFRELAGGIIHATRGANGFRAENITFKNNVTSYNNTGIIPSIQVTGICIDDDSGGVYSMSPRLRNITSDGGISQTDASSLVYGYQTDLVNVQSAAETFASIENLSAVGIGELLDFWARGARIAGLFGVDGKGVMLKLIYGAADLDITGVFGRRNALGDILMSNAAGGSIPAPAKTVVRGIDIRGIDIRDSGKGFDYAYSLTRYPSAQSAQAAISVKSEGVDGTLWPTDIRMEGTTVAYDGSGVGATSCPAPLVISNSGPDVSYTGRLVEAASTRKVLFLQNPLDTTKRPEVMLKNPPYVAAYPGSAQTLASGAAIVFGTEVEDRLNSWDGTIFRPPFPGEYRIYGQVRVGSVAAGVTCGVELQKAVYGPGPGYAITWTKVKRSLMFQGSAGEGYMKFDFREFMSPVTNPLDSSSLTDQYRLAMFTSGASLDVTAAGDLTWIYINPVD